jgi:molecular chaperone GrpE (heat shock protein)
MKNLMREYCLCRRSKLEEGLNAAEKVRELEKQLEEIRKAKKYQDEDGQKKMLDEIKGAAESESEKRLKLIHSLIKFRDQLLMFKENAEMEETSRLLSSLYRETGRFMSQSGIELLNGGGNFSADYQTAVDTVPTDQKELVGTVQSTFRDGYIVDGRMLRPQEVVVYVDAAS